MAWGLKTWHPSLPWHPQGVPLLWTRVRSRSQATWHPQGVPLLWTRVRWLLHNHGEIHPTMDGAIQVKGTSRIKWPDGL